MRSGDTRRAKDRRGPRAVPRPTQPVRPVKPGYSDLRRGHLADLARQIATQWEMKMPLEVPVGVAFRWVGDQRADRDGIRHGSKFILDALVRAGVLLTDAASHVPGPFSDEFAKGAPGVIVDVFPVGDPQAYRFVLAGRLPDANEMIEAARLEGARREREAARIRADRR